MFNCHSNGVWDTNGNQLLLPGRKEIVEWVSTAYRSLQATEQVCTSVCCSVQESYSYKGVQKRLYLFQKFCCLVGTILKILCPRERRGFQSKLGVSSSNQCNLHHSPHTGHLEKKKRVQSFLDTLYSYITRRFWRDSSFLECYIMSNAK